MQVDPIAFIDDRDLNELNHRGGMYVWAESPNVWASEAGKKVPPHLTAVYSKPKDLVDKPIILEYRLIRTTRRLTFDILFQDYQLIYKGPDDGPYFKFIASNGYEVISRSRMDIQTERLWLLGAKHSEEMRSGTMVFSDNEKRDIAYNNFIKAIDEWANANGGAARNLEE